MITAFCRPLAFVAMTAALATTPQALAKDDQGAAMTNTVYVEGHLGSGLAKQIDETHEKMEKRGWRFVDMEAHVENGDTQGIWVTYIKKS